MPRGAAGQLALFAHHRKAAADRVGKGRGDEKAARFDADEQVGLVRADDRGELFDGGLPRPRMREQRRNVVKQDARFREIRDRADVVFEVHRSLLWRAATVVVAGYRVFA